MALGICAGESGREEHLHVLAARPRHPDRARFHGTHRPPRFPFCANAGLAFLHKRLGFLSTSLTEAGKKGDGQASKGQEAKGAFRCAAQAKYGTIVKYKWFGDGYIMLGFSSGYLNAVSTHMKEIGEEIFNMKLFTGEVSDMAISAENFWTAVSGDSRVYLLNMHEVRRSHHPCMADICVHFLSAL